MKTIVLVFLLGLTACCGRLIGQSLAAHSPADSVLSLLLRSDSTHSAAQVAVWIAALRETPMLSADHTRRFTACLAEQHSVYRGRDAGEANRLRMFLLAAAAAFPAHDSLYAYVRAELLFGHQQRNIAAAARAAGSFPDRAGELVSLFLPFLSPEFVDDEVDLEHVELQWPLLQPTSARAEIINTLMGFERDAEPALPALQKIATAGTESVFASDSHLRRLARQAIGRIQAGIPPCCRQAGTASTGSLQWVGASLRSPTPLRGLRALDQDGEPLAARHMTGRPMVLTFFYTRCINPFKCASTVNRLVRLQQEMDRRGLGEAFGIYGITYDPGYDTPERLRQFGIASRLRFTPTIRFLNIPGFEKTNLYKALQIRVNYGAGQVNQHGIQLFILDKKGRVAATCDNDLWTVEAVSEGLLRLGRE